MALVRARVRGFLACVIVYSRNRAHSCCSKADLAQALAIPYITAIEADIVLSRSTRTPIMAHPPHDESDLSYVEFLESILEDGKRSIKLDFKEPEAVRPCLKARTAAPARRTVYVCPR